MQASGQPIPFYSHFGEDATLAGIFKHKQVGTCLEVGAFDGLVGSTTLHFEKKGWNCILVEADPELALKARENRRANVFACAAGSQPGIADFLIAKGAEYLSTMVSTDRNISRIEEAHARVERVAVTVMRLDEILQAAKVDLLDFATIDVEGAELEVLCGFDLQRWRPRVLVLEDNSQGHDRRVRRHLKAKGYICFLSDGLNDWYAAKDDRELLTVSRLAAQMRRRVRKRLYEWTVGLLSPARQERLVRLKRRWFGKL